MNMREDIKELFTDDLLAYFSDEEQFNNLTHNIRGNIYLFILAHNIYDYVMKTLHGAASSSRIKSIRE